jgi:hypothetical protein
MSFQKQQQPQDQGSRLLRQSAADMTANDNFDLFYGMFKYNYQTKELLNRMRDNLANVERKGRTIG